MSKTISQSEYIHDYDDITARLDLYDELRKGLDDIEAGRVLSEEEFFARLRTELEAWCCIDNDNFDEEKASQELINEIQKGLDDIKAGRTIPAEEVHAMLKKKFEGYNFE